MTVADDPRSELVTALLVANGYLEPTGEPAVKQGELHFARCAYAKDIDAILANPDVVLRALGGERDDSRRTAFHDWWIIPIERQG